MAILRHLNGVYHLQPSDDRDDHRRHQQHDHVQRARQRGVHGRGSACFDWWGDALRFDTLFSTLYPINPFKKIRIAAGGTTGLGSDGIGDPWVDGASSFHPGGANFAFSDGSVQFLKESISSWPYNPATGYPLGVTYNSGVYTIAAGTRLGVYQQLSTRNGGEVVSSDQY